MFSKTCFIAIFFLSILCLICPNTDAQFNMDGVVGYWSFDAGTINGNTVQDVIGQNNGELDGNPKVVSGKVGNALEFNGENGVKISGNNSLDFNGAEEMTVAAWVNAANESPVVGVVTGCCGTIVAQRDMNGWALRFDGRNPNTEMTLIVQPQWQGNKVLGVPPFAKNSWHHMVGIVNNNELLLYIDGKLAVEADYNGPMSSNGTATEIGHASDGGFIGIIDEVIIYNRAVSDAEAKQLYQAQGLPVQPQKKLTILWGDLKTSF